MVVIESVTQENFVRRIAAHLLAEYPRAIVTLPEGENFAVYELNEERLHELIRVGIERARSFDLTHESNIAAFTALMFEVAPNFYGHRLCQVLLSDEATEPDQRIDQVLETLSEKNWESIRLDYDPAAWNPIEVLPETDDAEGAAEPEAVDAKKARQDEIDLAETVKVDYRR